MKNALLSILLQPTNPAHQPIQAHRSAGINLPEVRETPGDMHFSGFCRAFVAHKMLKGHFHILGTKLTSYSCGVTKCFAQALLTLAAIYLRPLHKRRGENDKNFLIWTFANPPKKERGFTRATTPLFENCT